MTQSHKALPSALRMGKAHELPPQLMQTKAESLHQCHCTFTQLFDMHSLTLPDECSMHLHRAADIKHGREEGDIEQASSQRDPIKQDSKGARLHGFPPLACQVAAAECGSMLTLEWSQQLYMAHNSMSRKWNIAA